MAEPQWTPGPWVARGPLGHASYITAADGTPIACGYEHGTAHGDANACLMKAAPDLYEALDILVRVHERAVRNALSRFLYDDDQEYEAAIAGNISLKTGRAALAKARGESIKGDA